MFGVIVGVGELVKGGIKARRTVTHKGCVMEWRAILASNNDHDQTACIECYRLTRRWIGRTDLNLSSNLFYIYI